MEITNTLFHENEIPKSEDFNNMASNTFGGLYAVLKSLTGASKHVILSGLQVVQASPVSMNVVVGPGVALNIEDETILNLETNSQYIAIENGSPQNRIDTLQAKLLIVPYDREQRAFRDPNLGGITYQDVNTKQRISVQFQVIKGVPDANVAPVKTAGWVKIAEILVPANRTSGITTAEIKNCTAELSTAETTAWTTEKGGTYIIKGLEDLKAREATHEGSTNVHGAVSTPTANKLITRDANGRAQVAAPSAPEDIAIQANLDAKQFELEAHTNSINPHSSTSSATGFRIVRRDSNGRAKIGAPATTDDIARLDTAMAVNENIGIHAGETDVHGATPVAVPNRMVMRDENGRAQVDNPSLASEIANKAYVDFVLTPEGILNAIKTVDGAGSGLDGDFLDGYTFADLLTQVGIPSLTHEEKYAQWATLPVGGVIFNSTLNQNESIWAEGAFPLFLNPKFLGRGYSVGGLSGSNLTEIDGIQFSDETAINPSATLAVARESMAGVNSAIRGYAMGGWTTTLTTEIDGIQFDTEAAINPASVLPVATYAGAGVSSAIRGYSMGGIVSGGNSSEIEGIQFDVEVAINPAVVLSLARQYPTGVNSAIRGYAMGGSAGSSSAVINGIQFSDETAINPSATLAVARQRGFGVNSATRGYAMGGSPDTLEIDGIQFSDETAINPAATLPTGRHSGPGVSSSIRGYALGGASSTEIDGIQFSDETTINPAAVLAVARIRASGFQSGWY